MHCDESITAFDTKKLPLDEAASDPMRIRLRLEGVNKSGSIFASMCRLDGVDCAFGVDGSQGDEGWPSNEPSPRGAM